MDYEEMKALILKVARETARKGPGWAQQGVVLREVASKKRALGDLDVQQYILTCWNDLFRDGVISWGYDIDNPGAPFFHVVERDLQGVPSAGAAPSR